MALKTTTGIAANHTEFLASLTSFLTATVGWVLHDSLSDTDKVLSTTGESGTELMYFRLSTDKQIVSDCMGDPSNLFRYLSIRGYRTWDAVSHTGTGEYGFFGPEIMFKASSTLWEGASVVPVVSGKLTYHYWDQWGQTSYGASAFNGRRVVVAFNSGGLYLDDMVTTEPGFKTITLTSYVNGCCYVRIGEQERLYVVSTSNFMWVDPIAGTYYVLPTPSTGAFLNGMNAIVWDGGDYIYANRGTGSTVFSRFKLSTETWETLPALPYAPNVTCNFLTYVPSTCSSFGFNAVLYNGNSSNDYAWVFNADTLTWDDAKKIAGLGAANSGVSVFDGKRYLYHRQYGTLYDWKIVDLKASPPTLATLGRTRQATSTYPNGFATFYLHMLVGKVRLADTIPIGYWFYADKDALTIVTQVDGKVFWGHCGKYDSYFPAAMRVTQEVTAVGSTQTITVDDTSGHVEGDEVIVWDQTTGSVGRMIVQQVLSATQFKAITPIVLSVGARIGKDPCPYVITNDAEIASTPLDTRGFETDGRAANYFHSPLVSSAAEIRGAGARATHLVWPKTLWCNWEEQLNFGQTGHLKQVFSAKKYAISNGDLMRCGAGKYQLFLPSESSMNGAEFNRAIAIGPY